ncbi:MAG: PCRF domain-containing protein [Phycisphaerales bacterium]
MPAVSPITLSTSRLVPTLTAQVLMKLAQIETEERLLGESLEDPAVLVDHKKVRELSVKRSAVAPVAEAYRTLVKLERDAGELEEAVRAKADPEYAALAAEELPQIRAQARSLVSDALSRLVNADDNRIGSVIVEVRAGTGGDEASLWARDLLEMYQKYAGRRGWSCEVLELTPEPGVGGVRSVTLSLKGDGVWSDMNFEAGVHSVKRVPATEAQGRIHTSTASVAVLPEPEEVDVKVDWANDVEEFATRAQGPGGQNVNKVETAWQVHHRPTGIIIKMMEAKSQQQNRERARRLLMARLYEAEMQRKKAERSAARKDQIGTGGRSEKIRTYRWKEGIAADERLPGEYQLRDLLAGDFSGLFGDLRELETQKRLAEL